MARRPRKGSSDGRDHDSPPPARRAAGVRVARHQGNPHRRRHQPRRHRQVRHQDRHRLPRPHAGAAQPPQPDRHHAARRGRPAHRLSPHHRGHRHRAGRVPDQGAGRPRRHPPLRQRHHPDGRDADRGGARRLQPALPDLEGELLQAQARHHGHRAVQGMVPGLRPARRADAARVEPLRRQQPPYRRELLQGPGARAARRRSRSTRARRTAVPSTKGVL